MCMRLCFAVLSILVSLCCTTLAGKTPAGPKGPVFTLNGKPISPYNYAMTSVGIDRKQILVTLDELTVVLDQAKTYAFSGDLKKDGRLYLTAGKAKQLIGIIAHEVYEDEGSRKVKPLAGLRADDLKHLRGICLDDTLSKQGYELLQQVDTRNIFFRVTDGSGIGNPKKFPPLPNTVMFLDVDESSSEGIKDYSHLKTFKSLVYLRISSLGRGKLDVKFIANSKGLAYLDLSGGALENVGALGELQKLRHLDLSVCRSLKESGFLSKLVELRELNIGHTKISDLSPLEGLKKIGSVSANMTPVTRLPKKRVASLLDLKVVQTQLTREQVAAFRAENPQCQVRYGWTETLRAALKGADRVRVRSGGTCHRRPKQERTLFEIKDAKGVKETIANIVLEPSDSGFHCMCCGNPSFEFYRKDKLLVTLGFHHGRSLRWMQGEWPGDGLLSAKSGDYICELLDKHGIKWPLEERNKEKKRQQAAAARMAVYRKILPDGVQDLLSEARSAESAVKAFVDGEKDKSKRVTLALKLIGSHNGSWNQRNILDPIAIALLNNQVPSRMASGDGVPVDMDEKEKISVTDIVGAISANQKDSMVVLGAARWFFGERKCGTIPDKEAAKLLPLIVAAGMTHPRQINRRRTMRALAGIKNKAALTELKKVMAGTFKVQPMKPHEQAEPGGMVEFTPGDSDVGETCTDQAYAALILAQKGDHGSLAAIRNLLKSAKEADSKKAIEKAIALLEKKTE